MSTTQKNPLLTLQKRLFASRFFVTALLLHVILVVFGGTVVLFKASPEPPDFTAEEGGGFVSGDENFSEAPPPPDPTQVQPETMTIQTPTPNTSSISAITSTAAPSLTTFSMPTVVTPVTSVPTNVTSTAMTQMPSGGPSSNALTAAQIKGIQDFTKGWSKGGKGGGIGTNVQSREFVFTAYLAKYSGGDWYSTNWLDATKTQIWGGSLPNLLYYMKKMSRDRIDAQPDAIPLDLSDEAAIMAKKPPFIFFTGHRDFVLTAKEVDVLQKYIRLGGCIWGDSSLPGRRSRFDIAFRREMRRVISDADKDWEVLPPNYPLYTKNLYYKEITTPPAGLNYYQEPVYALKFAGEVAIIYTANDYGDMWQIGLTEKGEVDHSRDDRGRWLATRMDMWAQRNVYFRNLEVPAVLNAYKFGTNVVIHLLTRWEDRVRKGPDGI